MDNKYHLTPSLHLVFHVETEGEKNKVLEILKKREVGYTINSNTKGELIIEVSSIFFYNKELAKKYLEKLLFVFEELEEFRPYFDEVEK